MRWQNYVIECVVSFVGGVNVFIFSFFNGIFVKYPCWWIAMTGDISIYNISNHYQASIWNQSWTHSSTVALNYKMLAWGGGANGREVFCNPSTTKEGTFLANSPKLFAIVSEMRSEGAPKPNLNPLIMYNTSVWHSWVSARPFKATLIFFYLQSCKSEEWKGRREVAHSGSAVADFVPVGLQCSAVPPKSRRSWGEPWRTNTCFRYSAPSGPGLRSRMQHANRKK